MELLPVNAELENPPLVITVILNTNRRQDTLACLATLAASDYPNHRIMVLDNSSTDGSVAAIAAAYPVVEIVHLRENRGYAGNNNVGIQLAMDQGAAWVFVLNEDTILAPDCISRLVEVGSHSRRVGIVGPMVYHFNEPHLIQSAGGMLGPSWKSIHLGQNQPDHGQFFAPRHVEWICGCAILVRREVIEEVGSLDERFFYYWEETEWCVRAGRAGWSIIHMPQARLWHKGVQRDYRPKPSVVYYDTRNYFLFLSKHQAPLPVWLDAWSQTLRTLSSWSLRPKWRDKAAYRDAMWHGALDFLRGHFGMMNS
jgi:GT2 family glycosyltransferase